MALLGGGGLRAGITEKRTFSPTLCFVTAPATSSASSTFVPSTLSMTSPACSRPSAGLSLVTAATTMREETGMSSSLSAATLAFSCDCENSSAFSCVDCCSVVPCG
ncbi:hypothetical protein GA0115252_171210 [Streptomyces sp. DfronAA-171]|nr:hypothetical protein GA0115252_171210 [Streptomyces sp. DfronAA-171]